MQEIFIYISENPVFVTVVGLLACFVLLYLFFAFCVFCQVSSLTNALCVKLPEPTLSSEQNFVIQLTDEWIESHEFITQNTLSGVKPETQMDELAKTWDIEEWAEFNGLSPKITLPSKQYHIFQQTDEWAKNNGFHYSGFFQLQFTPVIMVVWENAEKSSFLALVTNYNSPSFILETLLDNISLCTGNISDGIVSPQRPGCYVQHFPKKSLDELWKLHDESIRYLTEYGNVHLTPFHPDLWGKASSTDLSATSQSLEFSAFEIDENSGNRSLCNYIRSLPFYPLRWGYWHFYRRFFWVNKTIQEQVEMGRLFLPQHLPSGYEKYFVMWSPENNLKTFNN
ncbi:MAG: hypothetical protein LBP59_09175 [Planctomycetaceae bacterium]|jgi:hypothetical protein|nr:hypothetical protein [Planctomycetaceae bacterium]